MGCCVSTLDLWELEVPTVNPSVTATPCQLPFAREPFCARYRRHAAPLAPKGACCKFMQQALFSQSGEGAVQLFQELSPRLEQEQGNEEVSCPVHQVEGNP